MVLASVNTLTTDITEDFFPIFYQSIWKLCESPGVHKSP